MFRFVISARNPRASCSYSPGKQTCGSQSIGAHAREPNRFLTIERPDSSISKVFPAQSLVDSQPPSIFSREYMVACCLLVVVSCFFAICLDLVGSFGE